MLAGVDAVGGIRVPSGFCGVIGFRASHGAISHSGIIPVSTSLDTIGTCLYRILASCVINLAPKDAIKA